MMYIRYLLSILAWLTATVVGMFGGYHLARYFGIGDSIWGNSVDGYCGDAAYKANQAKAWYRKLWPCWFWSCIRNPANNLLRHKLNAEGVISSIEKRSKNLTIITLMNGKKYFFYHNIGGRYIVKFGWRFWADQIKVGEQYNASFVFNP